MMRGRRIVCADNSDVDGTDATAPSRAAAGIASGGASSPPAINNPNNPGFTP